MPKKEEKELITYTIYWRSGDKDYLKGTDVGDVLNRHGYADREIHNVFLAIPGIDQSFTWHPTLNIWFKAVEEK